MSDEGFIKLYRKMLNWQWADDCTIFYFFIKLLFKANYKDMDWHGIIIKRGQMITSIANLCDYMNLSKTAVRRCLNSLIQSGELLEEVKPNKYHIITITNYEKYQHTVGTSKTNRNANKSANKNTNRSTNRSTTSKEYKEVCLSPTEKDIRKVETNPAAPSAFTGKGLPPFGELNRFARTVPGSSDYIADEFYTSFELSRTAMPENWKELYKRFVSAGEDKRQEFTRAVTEGEYKERWGSY